MKFHRSTCAMVWASGGEGEPDFIYSRPDASTCESKSVLMRAVSGAKQRRYQRRAILDVCHSPVASGQRIGRCLQRSQVGWLHRQRGIPDSLAKPERRSGVVCTCACQGRGVSRALIAIAASRAERWPVFETWPRRLRARCFRQAIVGRKTDGKSEQRYCS